MLVYQITGGLLLHDGIQIGSGYSGKGLHKNLPSAESLVEEGPIPEGTYSLGEAYDSGAHGPITIPLRPDISNEMYHRGGFLIHGDAIEHPGEASEGCIILPRSVRRQVALLGEKLTVTA